MDTFFLNLYRILLATIDRPEAHLGVLVTILLARQLLCSLVDLVVVEVVQLSFDLRHQSRCLPQVLVLLQPHFYF